MVDKNNAGKNVSIADEASVSSELCWRGCSMEEIYRHMNPYELPHSTKVKHSDCHTVLYVEPINTAEDQPPKPLHAPHKWDSMHVRLPSSSKSLYPVTAEDGTSNIVSRWEMIRETLSQPITNSRDLQAAILTYNSKYDDQWDFRSLHEFFEDELDESETRVFFEDLLPRIIRLALRLPELIRAPIPLLTQNSTHSISLSQEQISCLLANAFLCTFPRRNTLRRKSEYSTFPDINFNRLFQSTGSQVFEKIKCICHYFRRVCPTECGNSNVPVGVVTFKRISMCSEDMPNWNECDFPLGNCPLHITSEGTIEDQGLGLLQVDFANKYLGGGVLGHGCVQEEIRFVICPELFISKLFTECLLPTEALLMIGCERYSNYTGYANTFEWYGNHVDATPRDTSRRIMTHIVAIDALSFSQPTTQYCERLMVRELNKAFVGFYHPLNTPAPGIASGNWGCGAFGGDATLKALLQLIVCTVTGRPLVYFTFGNRELRDKVHDMHTFFIENNISVCELWGALLKFEEQELSSKELYNFIYSCLGQNINGKNSLNMKCIQPTTSKLNDENSIPNACTNPIPAVQESKAHEEKDPNLSKEEINEIESPEESDEASELLISDDSESDAVLLAAAAAIPQANIVDKVNDNKTNTNAKATLNVKEQQRSEPRQRTLLEMLDTDYNSPASKRLCQH